MTCDICQIPMADWGALTKHFEGEHKQRAYAVCCKRKFTRRSELRDHVHVRHVDPDIFKCNQCDKVFAAEKFLEFHILRHIPEEKKEYTCTECSKNFADKRFLDFHIRGVHLKKYIKICELCGKSIHPNELKRHMLEHDGKSLPLVHCEICGIGLTHKKVLRLHMKYKHGAEGKQTVACHICKKISANAKALSDHMNHVHSKTIHKCTICGKCFKGPRCLKKHMPVHTGIEAYSCNWCPKTFKSSSNIGSHCRKHHPNEYEDQRQRKHKEKYKMPTGSEKTNTDISL